MQLSKQIFARLKFLTKYIQYTLTCTKPYLNFTYIYMHMKVHCANRNYTLKYQNLMLRITYSLKRFLNYWFLDYSTLFPYVLRIKYSYNIVNNIFKRMNKVQTLRLGRKNQLQRQLQLSSYRNSPKSNFFFILNAQKKYFGRIAQLYWFTSKDMTTIKIRAEGEIWIRSSISFYCGMFV